MAYLLDTSVLGRLADTVGADHPVAGRSAGRLRARGEPLHITPQNLIEFRNVATRPRILNGLGMSPAEAEATPPSSRPTSPCCLMSRTCTRRGRSS